MKYKNLILFIIFFLFIEIANSADTLEVWCLWSSNIAVYNKKCNDKSWFELYECRVINLCNSSLFSFEIKFCLPLTAKTIWI